MTYIKIEKLREDHEIDKLWKRKERQQKKFMTLRELNKKGERTGNDSNAADQS